MAYGYWLEPSRGGGSNSTHYLCFEQKYEIYQNFFFIRKFSFLVVKFSVYLNRLVFVMSRQLLALLRR